MNEPQLHDTVIDGDRWYRIVAFSEDDGTKLSDGRWVCASKFVPVTRACWRYEPQPVECPPGVHSLFDPCPGNCTKPVVEEAELFEELWSMEYRITGDKSKAQAFARDFLNRYERALASRPAPSYRTRGTRTANLIDPEVTP